ncbi:hypothetical protein BH23CHL5_BH23CHL5_11160 [soil metagenome]
MTGFRGLFAALAFVLVAGAVMAAHGGSRAFAQDVGTPVATADDGTPVAVLQEGTPEAQPIRVITLVAWYQTDASGEFIQLGPMASNDQLISGPGDSASALTGTADFDSDENDNLPRIELGDSIFDGRPAFEGDPDTVFRWTYPQGDATFRPATLVIQVEATAGPYTGFTGSATFVSRSTPGSGVLVIMVNPPDES